MKIRLTSDNVIPKFDLWNNDFEAPEGWIAGSSNKNGSVWQLNELSPINSAYNFELENYFNGLRSYINVYKTARVYGNGTYKPCVSETAITLTNSYQDLSVLATETELNTNGLNQDYTTGTQCFISSLGCYFELETTMMRDNSYSENIEAEPMIVRQKNSKKLVMSEKYNPLSMQLEFILCLEQARAVQSFFNTCLKYGVGFSIEVLEEDLISRAWATETWGKLWGSSGTSAYSSKFHMDLASSNFVEQPISGVVTIPVILQKSEIKYANF